MVNVQRVQLTRLPMDNGVCILSRSIADAIDEEAFGIGPSEPAIEGCRGRFK